MATGDGTTAELSWGAVAGASSYNIYRTDGEHQCDFGKELMGSTMGTTFSESGLKAGRGYYWVVTPMGTSASCFGPASNCASINDDATFIFGDGFESGDTTAWDVTVP